MLDGDTVGPMRVRVLDQYGEPLPDALLFWENRATPEGLHTLLPLTVRAADQFGDEMPDSRVRWRTEGEEYGELTGAEDGVEIIEETDGNGESTVLLILGSFVGEHVVTAEPTNGLIEDGLEAVAFEIQSGSKGSARRAIPQLFVLRTPWIELSPSGLGGPFQ